MRFLDALSLLEEEEGKFRDKIEALVGANFLDLSWDTYDSSLEFINAENDLVLTLDVLKFIWDNGFARVWVNHKDKTETYYVPDKEPARGKKAF